MYVTYITIKGVTSNNEITPLMLLKKMMSTAEKATLQGEGLISVPPASFRGRPMSRFTHFRSLRGLICDAKSLGVTLAPLNQPFCKMSFLIFHTSRSNQLGHYVYY